MIATLEDEEAEQFWQFVQQGHIAQDEGFEKTVEEFTKLCPEGYTVYEVKLSMKRFKDLGESE